MAVFEDFDDDLANIFNVPTTSDTNRWSSGTTDPYGSSSKSTFVNDNGDPGVIDYDPNSASSNMIYYKTTLAFGSATDLHIKCKLGGENNGSTAWDSINIYLLDETASEPEGTPVAEDIIYQTGNLIGTSNWAANWTDVIINKTTSGASGNFKLAFKWVNDTNTQTYAYSANLGQMEWVGGVSEEVLTGSIVATGSIVTDMNVESSIEGAILASGSIVTNMTTEAEEALSGSILASGSIVTAMNIESSISGSVVASGSIVTNMLLEQGISGSILASGSIATNMDAENGISGSILASGSIVTNMITSGEVVERAFTTNITTVDKYTVSASSENKYDTIITTEHKHPIEITTRTAYGDT